MNSCNSWQYRPLSDEKEAERDALIRIILKASQELAKQRLVRCTNFITEQRVVRKRPPKFPGADPIYKTFLIMDPEPHWSDQYPLGEWSVEVSVRVDQLDRDIEVDTTQEGKVVARIFAAELAALAPIKVKTQAKQRKSIGKPGVLPLRSADGKFMKKISGTAISQHNNHIMPLAAKPVQQTFALFC